MRFVMVSVMLFEMARVLTRAACARNLVVTGPVTIFVSALRRSEDFLPQKNDVPSRGA